LRRYKPHGAADVRPAALGERFLKKLKSTKGVLDLVFAQKNLASKKSGKSFVFRPRTVSWTGSWGEDGLRVV